MGLMECPAQAGALLFTPHPVTLEGQTRHAMDLQPGERLCDFLLRHVPETAQGQWLVTVGGKPVPQHLWKHVFPKDGQFIEVRARVGKQALYIVAMIALTYFTFGLGAGVGGAWGAAGGLAGAIGGVGGAIVAGAVFAGGSMLINKVLGPKPPSGGLADRNTVHSLGVSRNRKRPYEPLSFVFGRVKYAPDVISDAYSWYEGNTQYVGFVLSPGVNVHRVEELYLGDALLSSFEGVSVYYAGFTGMPEQTIPLFSNANTVAGGDLNKDRTWVQRTTPPGTVRIQNNINYVLGDADSKGKPFTNRETVEVQYRVIGATNWMPLVQRTFANSNFDEHRVTLARDVVEGQYDVRMRILGTAMDGGGSNGRAVFTWREMTSVQADTTDYTGIQRIGIVMKATGQLQGTPDEIRCVSVAQPVPVWKGDRWVVEETSNPGAHILAYARGIHDPRGELMAGIGQPDDETDIAALQAYMLHCAANDLTYDFVVSDPRSNEDMLNAIALAGMAEVSWATGLLSVVWAWDDQPLQGVVNMGTIRRGEFQVDYALDASADGVEVTYFDVEAWETRTLRIPAPGVTTMLFPAQIALEGVGREAHAALLGRFHLAQSLYQNKDISYGTDIEHLSYRRLSLLSLSHDLTQWGFSGRVSAVAIDGRAVTVTLDNPVPAPPPGGAYVGLRIPGERTYRVFQVQPFAGETTQLTLVPPINPGEATWPSDARVPGVGFYRGNGEWEPNPPDDTLWCYDFKATPGYRVRVVGIEPENDANGARVAVVPEGPEYWLYVRTGQYIPAPNQSLLPTRPIVSNLVISERQVPQGDTLFTELVATFDISGGAVGDVVVQMSNENDELEEVARTTTRTAVWRIPRAGTYQIVVRPFSPDGQPGIAAATIYSTVGADAPPVLVDLFDVQERSGGVRLYTWGWLTGTTQSADFAGVEIRYIAGNVPAPDWDAMTPVGTDGYYTAPFEAVIPESGQWTFACRSRNTSGTLSTGVRVVTRNLGANLGEQIGGIGDSIDWLTQEQIAQQQALDAEVLARAQADIAVAEAAGEDATAKANAARDEALAGVDSLANVVEQIDTRVDGVDGQVGNLASRVGVVEARMPGASGVLATQASVTNLQTATAAADAALADSITAVQATANGAQGTATQALTASNANAAAITQVSNRQGEGRNLLADPNFDAGVAGSGWTVGWNPQGANAPALNTPASYSPPSSNTLVMYKPGALTANAVVGTYVSEFIAIDESDELIASGYLTTDRAYAVVGVHYFNSSKQFIDEKYSPGVQGTTRPDTTLSDFTRAATPRLSSVPGARFVQFVYRMYALTSGDPVARLARPQLEIARPQQVAPSDWSSSGKGLSSATLALQVAQDAQITLTTNVNGHISGMYSKNDGQRSSMTFLSRIFNFISDRTGIGIEMHGEEAWMRFYRNSVQLVLGAGFGVSGDFIGWFGPNIGVAACDRARGTLQLRTDGSGYFGGSLSAGTLHTAARWNFAEQWLGSTTYMALTHANSNGRTKTITLSGGASHSTTYPGPVSGSYPPRTATLRRRLFRGSTVIHTEQITATSDATVTNEPGIGFQTHVSQGWPFSSITVTDTFAGTGDVPYSVVIDRISGTNYGINGNVIALGITEQ